MLAKTFYGLEDVLAEELRSIGAQNIKVLNRAVTFTGNQRLLYDANLSLRTALSILKPIAEFDARNEDQLYREIKKIDWANYFTVDETFIVDSTVNSTQFTHSHYVALKVKDAIVDQFRDRFNKRPSIDLDHPDLRINIHISENYCTVSLDSSGESLHRRGYRKAAIKAPLNEVLAAGMVILSGFKGQKNFIDPMCGSGTIVIEAAMIAYNIAPNMLRKDFGFMHWHDYDRKLWKEVKGDAIAKISTFDHKIIGSDMSASAIRIAQKNIQRAKLEDKIELIKSTFDNLNPPDGPGTIVMNPPYGERMQKEDIIAFYHGIGDQLKQKYPGYNAWILSSNIAALKRVGLKASNKKTLFNGPLECRYHEFVMYEGSKKNN